MLFLLVGVVLLGAILLRTDLSELWRQMANVGVSGMLAVLCVYALYFAADAVSWQIALPAVDLSWRWIARMFGVRMIGEAYNNITPTASLGGEPIKAWLLKSNWGIALRDSGASLVIAKTTSMFALAVFVAIGFALMLDHPRFSLWHKQIAVVGLAFIVAAALVFYLMQHMRLSTLVARRLGATRLGQRIAGVLAAAEDIDRQFAAFYSGHGLRLAGSFVFALANWLLGALEVYLILYLIGQPLSFTEVWMIECMVQLVRTLTFFVPAAIGTQEGAFLIGVGIVTGLPSAGVATALVRRCRDLIWIGLSLALASCYAVTPRKVMRGDLDVAES